jgi:hypothetical protein
MYSTLDHPRRMYDQYDYDFTFENLLMNNRLFCTFTAIEDLEALVGELTRRYSIMYNKMFVCTLKATTNMLLHITLIKVM